MLHSTTLKSGCLPSCRPPVFDSADNKDELSRLSGSKRDRAADRNSASEAADTSTESTSSKHRESSRSPRVLRRNDIAEWRPNFCWSRGCTLSSCWPRSCFEVEWVLRRQRWCRYFLPEVRKFSTFAISSPRSRPSNAPGQPNRLAFQTKGRFASKQKIKYVSEWIVAWSDFLFCDLLVCIIFNNYLQWR